MREFTYNGGKFGGILLVFMFLLFGVIFGFAFNFQAGIGESSVGFVGFILPGIFVLLALGSLYTAGKAILIFDESNRRIILIRYRCIFIKGSETEYRWDDFQGAVMSYSRSKKGQVTSAVKLNFTTGAESLQCGHDNCFTSAKTTFLADVNGYWSTMNPAACTQNNNAVVGGAILPKIEYEPEVNCKSCGIRLGIPGGYSMVTCPQCRATTDAIPKGQAPIMGTVIPQQPVPFQQTPPSMPQQPYQPPSQPYQPASPYNPMQNSSPYPSMPNQAPAQYAPNQAPSQYLPPSYGSDQGELPSYDSPSSSTTSYNTPAMY